MSLPLVYCDVKYKCDFPAHQSGHPGGAMQVIRSVDQGSIPGPPSTWFPLVYCDQIQVQLPYRSLIEISCEL